MNKLFAIIIVFAMGFMIGIYTTNAQQPQYGAGGDSTTGDSTQFAFNMFAQAPEPKDSPMDRIPEKAIVVYKDRIILDIQNAQWATFTNTHSMEPVITAGANAIEIVPKSEDEIKVGDIVSYKSEYAEGYIIHRVVYKGQDEKGTYYIMKGDNILTNDPGRVRFSQIQRVVVAIIY